MNDSLLDPALNPALNPKLSGSQTQRAITRARLKREPRFGWSFFALSIASLVFVIPFYVMVSSAFKTPKAADVSRMWQLPSPISFDGIIEAWDRLGPNFFNSIKLVLPATLISSLIGAFNGYLLSKFQFRFSTPMFTIMLVGMFLPYQVVLIPMIKFLSAIHLYGTLPGLILVHVVYGIPITTLMFRNFYVSIPKALIEAASVDGAGILRTFRSIVLPVSLPGFVVAGIFQFTNIWNDFLFGVVVMTDPRTQPVTVALNNLSGNQSVNWNVVMAGALIAALPTALAYIGFGRYYVEGLTAGSVK
jgi:glucose/mannose transport system permease protein